MFASMFGEEEIDLYEAIRQIRKLTGDGKHFSFVHSTWDSERAISHGFRSVENATLRPAARGDDLVNADFKIFYFDHDIMEPRNCWQILIMSFNGKKVVLN